MTNQQKIMTTKDLIIQSIFEHIKKCQSCKNHYRKIANHTVKKMIIDNTKDLT
jgi:predicted anti-sigma-YlaC factor YlaD